MLKNLSKHPLIAGSFLLTLTGFVSRLIGFFYRVYLSRIFGEEGMGVYQLLSPVLAMSFSLTAAGFQTAISKFVAEQHSDTANNQSTHKSLKPMLMGLSISLPLSILVMLLLVHYSEWIATEWLCEIRTVSMIRIMAFTVPLSAVHACLHGYFYGLKKAVVPAASQILEQLCRVGSVYLLTYHSTSQGIEPSLNITVLGLFVGELISTLMSAFALYCHGRKQTHAPLPPSNNLSYKTLLFMVIPLIANRVTLNILQSIETVSIPNGLKAFGYDTSTALSVYGVLTGMAFPLIFFPNAITSSIAVLLLPLISEKSAAGDIQEVRKLTIKTIKYCSMLGFSCMAIFLLFGNFLGTLLYQSTLAGYFITTLSFICPFLYLNNTLSAILQGMGKVISLFVINVAALLIRLLFIKLFIPTIGIQGYLWGLLVSQLFQSTTYIFLLSGRKALPQTL